MNDYLISVIVPCYNQAKYLDECLKSLSDQTFKNWECIIINDGSTDNTEEVSNKWISSDNRFKYYRKENEGLSHARNFGLKLCNGDFIQFLDSDDFIAPDKFLKSIQHVTNTNFDKMLIVTDFLLVKTALANPIKPTFNLNSNFLTYNNILFGWDKMFSIPIHCGFFSVQLFKKFRFPANLKAREDWIMWLYIFQAEVECHFISEGLAFYRLHDDNMTRDKSHMLQNTEEALRFLDKIIPPEDYKNYLLSTIKSLKGENDELNGYINKLTNSKGYIWEKKTRKFIKKILFRTDKF